MDLSTLFRTKENLNLDKNTLTILRYIAIIGQILAISIVFYYLNLPFPIIESYLIISENVKIKDVKGSIFADKLFFDIKKQTLKIAAFKDNKINANIKLNEKRF